MSDAITFQVASDRLSAFFSQASCVARQDARLGRHPGRLLVRVRPAIGAQVDAEDLERRPIAEARVEPVLLQRIGRIGM